MTYSEIVLDHFGNPRNVGKPEKYTVQGVSGDPNAGPFMVLYLDVVRKRIQSTGYNTYGCAAAIAAGSYLTERIKGMTVGEAAALQAKDVETGLGGLPLGKRHCADTAISALQNALEHLA